MPVTPTDSRNSNDQGTPADGQACPSCGAALPSEARFCHACGVSLAGEGGGGKWSVGKFAGLSAMAGVIAVAAFAVVTFSEPDSPPPPAPRSPMPMFGAPPAATLGAPPVAVSGQPPDLSRMTPREAADRLFNRIMMASEQGNRAEALRFVPMAVQAYGGLRALDRDAQYHLGLIHAVAGNRAIVDQQIAALRQGAPNHLLALVLEHDTAERSGDRAAVSRVLAAFSGAYNTEIVTGRPEYDAHRNSIERVRAIASPVASPIASPAAPPIAAPARAIQNGTTLFAKNCAGCHGAGAVGSDKGPPLVHKIYEPSHHDDGSFHRAVRQGVRPHHWSFGAMPPISGVSDDEAGRIISHVRKLQRAAGIQ